MFIRLPILSVFSVLIVSMSAHSSSSELNGDGRVDAADAGILFAVWGTDGGETGADFNSDGIVDARDAGALFENWTGDAPSVGAREAAASYNPSIGLIEISASGVVNVFVESASSSLTPGGADRAPTGTLVSDNSSRVGLTGFAGVEATNWKSQNTPNLPCSDLSLVVSHAISAPAVTYPPGSANFVCTPEPASASLLSLALAGLLACRRSSLVVPSRRGTHSSVT